MRKVIKTWRYLHIFGGYKVKIDKEDFDKIQGYNWKIRIRETGRTTVKAMLWDKNNYGKYVSLARLILNPPKDKVVCHKTQDTLDYRKENLVVTTIRNKQRMQKKRTTSVTSIYKGVSLEKNVGTWRARIKIDDINLSLGSFDNEADAARAYNKAAAKYYREFAFLNKIE